MTEQPMIAQVNPGASYQAHKAAIDAAITRVLESGWYVLGKEVEQFEQEFADFVGTEFSVGVANGTDAITLALLAAGITSNDEVATVALTALPTIAAIGLMGAAIRLVDVNTAGLICPDRLETALKAAKGKIKAIVPVHLYGQMADMESIHALAQKYDCIVIEDCAQAHGAQRSNKRAGTLGAASCFSFYPTKNLGALGDGGAVATNDRHVRNQLLQLRQYGWENRKSVDNRGMNSRLDEVQAAILRTKLPHLAEETNRRRAIAQRFDHAIEQGTKFQTLEREHSNGHAFHQYVCISDNREELQRTLKNAGIGTGVHYPIPVHLEPGWQGRLIIPNQGLPESERLASTVFSLPMHPHLREEDIARIEYALIAP